ncbi:MAG: formamidopyrimidine-DNA glycosylase, partial [Gammaproteobacteria bacterium]|nr:formamidopyrimidine-DNA glycosylase [Gammaproteobacteria bacterium]
MPELPDITLYLESLQKRICGAELLEVFVHNPFFLRSVITDDLTGRVVCDLQRLGKRIAIGLQPDCWLVIHLMIAGRLQWSAKRPAGAGRNVLADLVFSNGNLRVTEAGSKRRASLYV